MGISEKPVPGGMPPSATASAASFALWDATALDRQVGKNSALQGRLLTKFIQNGKRQVAELTTAAVARQPSLVAQIAHVLKSSARSVGALQLGESCQLAEQAGSTGKIADCEALAQVIAEDFAKVSQVIQESLI